LLHWKPFFGDFEIQPGIGQSTLFETFAKICGTASSNEIENRLGDKTTAVAFSGDSVKNPQCGIWKDDVDALTHTILLSET